MLDTWTLRVLVEVGERGSFSAAAQALSMTQPAVSRQIAGLERRLGVRLFQRAPRGVRATAAGEAALELANGVLARLQAMEARLSAFTSADAGDLRLCALPSANVSLVPEAIRRFGEAHPAVTVTLLQVDPADSVAAVRDGRVDLALITAWDLPSDERVDGVELIRLIDDELWLALPDQHPLAGRHRVRLHDLREEAWIEGAHPDCLGSLTQLTDALGGPPRIAFTCDDWGGKQALVAAGAGITLIPGLALAGMRPDLALRLPSPRLPTRRLFVALAPVPHRAPTATAMCALLVDLARAAARRRHSASPIR